VKEQLEYLPPALPILISNYFYSPRLSSLEDGSQVVAALEQRDHVKVISLKDLTSSLLEKFAAVMQEKFPSLEYVMLLVDDELDDETQDETDEMVPSLPDSFLGGSAPSLQTIWLSGISFPEAPKFFLSAGELISIRLDKIPDSGYISPDALATGLSACTKLEKLFIQFLSHYPHPDLASQEVTLLPRISLPALHSFSFGGNGRYFDIFCQRMDTRVLLLDVNVLIPHDVSASRYVYYEVYPTPPEFSLTFYYRTLTDPVFVED
jgi:hypothetical protein